MGKLAFIGLGRMGSGMARRALDCGHELQVYNRTADRGADLVSRGALQCATPREACLGAQAVVSMVADDQASRAIWYGTGGALAAQFAPNALAIECSTLSYDWVLELSGELTFLVGADPENLTAARPLLAGFANKIVHFGRVGTGTAYKLLVNMLGAVQIASAAETMAIAEKIGLDLGMVADALAAGQAASPQVIRNTRRIADGHHGQDILFTPQLRLKDVEYGLALARKVSIGSPFGRLAGEMFQQLCALDRRQINESKIIDVARLQPVKDP
jgi:3-hydroxyisobutyrate dehydrogenase